MIILINLIIIAYQLTARAIKIRGLLMATNKLTTDAQDLICASLLPTNILIRAPQIIIIISANHQDTVR